MEAPCGLACSPSLLLLPAPALAGVREKVAALAPTGLVLVLDAEGNELVAQNANEPFVPASVTKIVTAWLAMEVLAADYRFETRFYLDGKRVLYVRGGGDPFLISEELVPLATELVAAVGKEPITGIVLDASYYPSKLRIPGIEDTDEAYNALNSALAVPSGSGRIQYAGELTAAFIERAGGSVKGKISSGTLPEGLEPVYVHRQSRPFRRSSSSYSATRTTTSPTRSSWRSTAAA